MLIYQNRKWEFEILSKMIFQPRMLTVLHLVVL